MGNAMAAEGTDAGQTDQTQRLPDGTDSGKRKRVGFGAWLVRVVLIVFFLIGAVTTLLPQGRALTRGTILLPALVTNTQPEALKLSGDPIRFTEITVPSRGGTTYLDIYEPSDPPPPIPGSREAVIMVT